jgi:predicted alpha/beta superfamily hydrolase
MEQIRSRDGTVIRFKRSGSEPLLILVLGHSYGGLCSLEAAMLTESISKLVLYEASLPTDEPSNRRTE